MVQSVAQEFVMEEEEEEDQPTEQTDPDELTHFMHQLEPGKQLTKEGVEANTKNVRAPL